METRTHKLAVAEIEAALNSQVRAAARSTFRAIGGGIARAESGRA
jgi:hypothetical protein